MCYTLAIENKGSFIYFVSKFIATTLLVDGLYLINVSSLNLQICIEVHTWVHLIMNNLRCVNLTPWVNYSDLHCQGAESVPKASRS